MSDSSNDGSKDTKESEVSSTCSDGRQNRPTEEDNENDPTPGEPKPRSLSPDTSDAAPADQAGPSHLMSAQDPSPSLAQSTENSGEALTSTTEEGKGNSRAAESSQQEAGVSSGEPSAENTIEPAVSSALPEREGAKSSSSDEYFEADASFGPLPGVQDVTGSQDRNNFQEAEVSLGSQLSTTRHPWELDISSDSNSQDAVPSGVLEPSSHQLPASEIIYQEAEVTLRRPQKAWEMLMSYESSSDDEEAGSSNQQVLTTTQLNVSASQNISQRAEASPSVQQVSTAQEISTTQQQSSQVSPSNSQEPEQAETSNVQETVSDSQATLQDVASASSSQTVSEIAAVSGSQEVSQLGRSQRNSQEVEQSTSSEQVLTSSGQLSTSQEIDVSESHDTSQITPSLSSPQQPDVSESIHAGQCSEQVLTSSGQLSTSHSQDIDVSASQETSQEAEASPALEQLLTSSIHQPSSIATCSERETSSQQGAAVTVSGSDDLQEVGAAGIPLCSESSSLSSILPLSRRDAGRQESSEEPEAGPSSQISRQIDVSRSNDLQEVESGMSSSSHSSGSRAMGTSRSSNLREVETGMSSSSEPSGQRPDSPSSRRDMGRTPPSQVSITNPSNIQLHSLGSNIVEVEDSMSSSSEPLAPVPSTERTAERQQISSPQAESSVEPSLSSGNPPSVSSAVTESSDEEPGSGRAVSSASRRPRPLESTGRLSVLAQQLMVSSASGRGSQSSGPRQLVSSQHEARASGRHGSDGPDSTTTDQSAETAEEVSTTGEEQPGQVSTSQQRVVSTSWPPITPSRVSSSADSSAGHISTSARPVGLLASRLSRDPQVSTSAGATSAPQDHDLRDGGASSTTSGLRGLLSNGNLPAGVSSSRPRLVRTNFGSPNQSTAEAAQTVPSPSSENREDTTQSNSLTSLTGITGRISGNTSVGSSVLPPVTPSSASQPSTSTQKTATPPKDAEKKSSKDSKKSPQDYDKIPDQGANKTPSNEMPPDDQAGPSHMLATASDDKFPPDEEKKSKSDKTKKSTHDVRRRETREASLPSQPPHSPLNDLAGPSEQSATAPEESFPVVTVKKRGRPRKQSPAVEDPKKEGNAHQSRHTQPGSSKDPLRAELTPANASLMEQLRKAGVIITPVPNSTPPKPNPQEPKPSIDRIGLGDLNNVVIKIKRLPEQAYHVAAVSNEKAFKQSSVPTETSENAEVMEMIKPEEESHPVQPTEMVNLIKSPNANGGGESESLVVQAEGQPDPLDTQPKRKRRPRKPIDLNPDLLRPKRPRRAKEKPPEEEEEKPKRGRKRKMKPEPKPDPNIEAPPIEEVKVEPEVIPEVVPDAVATLPEKPKSKSREPKGKAAKEKAAPKVVPEPPLRPPDEETRMSADDSQHSRPLPMAESTPKKKFTKNTSMTGVLQPMIELEIGAEALVEYQWPLNDRHAEAYMVQEQVTQYLGIKSFKRKYPDLKRRPVEPEEREYLQERGLVTEAMCDLGLTAVVSSEVLDVMSADFQEKYEEYRRALRDRQAREVSGKQKAAAAAAGAEKGKQVDQKTRAMQSAAKWNASLNRDRREERRCCCDLQTLSVQFPQNRRKAMTKEVPRLGNYPVSLIPNQFTDFYKRYTPAELRYLPVNTVLYGPMRPNEHDERGSEGSPSESEDSSSSDESSSSSSSDGTQDTEETGSTAAEPEPDIPAGTTGSASNQALDCKVCKKPGIPENMVNCAQCTSSGHPLCLDLSTDMLPHIRRYAWQCTDCKTCIQCKDPADEDKMLFCDMCDRGYHIYCVGLRKVPNGRWHCQECAVCGSCGSLEPGGPEIPTSPSATPEKGPPQWQHEFKKGEKGTRVYAQTLCVPCSRLWRKGSFCQLCSRCFRKPDLSSMLSCSVCDKWMHAECCSLPPGSETSKTGNFVCEVCQEGSQVRASTGRIIKLISRN